MFNYLLVFSITLLLIKLFSMGNENSYIIFLLDNIYILVFSLVLLYVNTINTPLVIVVSIILLIIMACEAIIYTYILI